MMPWQKKSFRAVISILGMVTLSYLAGAVVMLFQLPSSEPLAQALFAARAWYASDSDNSPAPPAPPPAPTTHEAVDQPDLTFDGFTLYATLGGKQKRMNTQALLLNMRGQVVHRWAVAFSDIWPNAAHIQIRVPDALVCFFACHLYPNGDLLAVLHGKTQPIGCGLVKLDKDSNVLWSYPAAIHHDIDVGEDGTIYTLEQEFVYDLLPGLERIPTPCEVDKLLILSPDGQLVREPISVLAALADSPYAELLDALKLPSKRHTPPPGSTAPATDYQFMVGDPLHTNSVKVLKGDLAAKFPLFKAGQVLLSIRDLSALVVLDPVSAKVVWAARGPWYAQHDASFLANGHILLYDNLGVANGSRVLEYDPQTQSFPWSYGGPAEAPFYSSERGACQRLPNGNTFIVNSETGEMIEVTGDRRTVWSCTVDGFIATARRYGAEQLPFLGGEVAPRP